MSEIDILMSNFPFQTIRPGQARIIREAYNAFNSGIKFVIIEAPTGFGKSPVAVTLARTFGTSYIISATKDLQTQYIKDFPFLRAVKGMNNFSCLIKEDFVNGGIYACGKCGVLDTYLGKKITNVGECGHRTVEYGTCRSTESYKHDRLTCNRCKHGRAYSTDPNEFHNGCRYRTYIEDYDIEQKNTTNETIEICNSRNEQYQRWYKISGRDSDRWMHTENFDNFDKIREDFTPCPYYDQLNRGILSSHSIFNYANFLTFLRLKKDPLPRRDLLILDEGHSIENQLLGQIEISISKKVIQRYIPKDIFGNTSYSYHDSIAEKWLNLLHILNQELDKAIPELNSEETRLDAMEYQRKIEIAISDIERDPNNWIVSDIQRENEKLTRAEFKPLDLSSYSQKLFEKCDRILIMSATILDIHTFCRSLGLDINTVKFIRADSDFPVQNRPIYQMNTARLNYTTLQKESIQREIANAVDTIMNIHSKVKGIIHCTSYAQVHFIQRLISTDNKKRLIETDPERFNGRDEAITEHFSSEKPTVLISPSLHTGLDLKNERSRFQIIVKIPYPNRSDRWIEAKRLKDESWYRWQTCIRLLQAYGRSVRSRDDWAMTYVLDAGFLDFVKRNNLPNWYTDAIADASIDILASTATNAVRE